MHFIDILLNGDDSAETARQLLWFVHGFNAHRSPAQRIAIAFPDITPAQANSQATGAQLCGTARPGNRIRVFGNPALLREFADSKGPSRLARQGLVECSAPAPVPAGAPSVRFVRDRGVEKRQPNGAYARRLQRRALSRGEQLVSPPVTPRKHNGLVFAVESQRTGLSFALLVRKEQAASAALVDVSSYGFCGPASGVPDF